MTNLRRLIKAMTTPDKLYGGAIPAEDFDPSCVTKEGVVQVLMIDIKSCSDDVKAWLYSESDKNSENYFLNQPKMDFKISTENIKTSEWELKDNYITASYFDYKKEKL